MKKSREKNALVIRPIPKTEEMFNPESRSTTMQIVISGEESLQEIEKDLPAEVSDEQLLPKALKRTVIRRPKLIFIVEDNTMYAKSLQYYLADKLPESEIKIFSRGEDCIEKIKMNPDSIIMDYYLNSKAYNAINGLQTIKEIRNQNTDTDIILLSSQQNMEITIEAIKAYDCDYVVKNEASFEKIYNCITGK